MAGEIKINDVSIATESGGTVTLGNATLGSTVVLGTNASPIASNLVLAAGNGIDFSAASGSAAGSSSAVLDDYEEGDWTPVVADAGSGGNVGTSTVNYAKYTKIGREVTLYGYLSAIGTTGMTSINSFHIRGLPFSASNMGGGNFYTYLVGRDAATVSSCALVITNHMKFFLFTTNKVTSDKSILVSDITSGSSEFIFTVSYHI